MDNDSSSPTVTNCMFSGNAAVDDGGGMWNAASSPTVSLCTFNGNTAGYGGGMGNTGSAPTVSQCTFSGNTAGQYGGGLCNFSSSSPSLTNCVFAGNTAAFYGGGMYNDLVVADVDQLHVCRQCGRLLRRRAVQRLFVADGDATASSGATRP